MTDVTESRSHLHLLNLRELGEKINHSWKGIAIWCVNKETTDLRLKTEDEEANADVAGRESGASGWAGCREYHALWEGNPTSIIQYSYCIRGEL